MSSDYYEITLVPIAMVTPTQEGIYAPSSHRSSITVSKAEFMEKYADNPRNVKVSFAEDGKSNSQLITAYSDGMDGWYFVS